MFMAEVAAAFFSVEKKQVSALRKWFFGPYQFVREADEFAERQGLSHDILDTKSGVFQARMQQYKKQFLEEFGDSTLFEENYDVLTDDLIELSHLELDAMQMRGSTYVLACVSEVLPKKSANLKLISLPYAAVSGASPKKYEAWGYVCDVSGVALELNQQEWDKGAAHCRKDMGKVSRFWDSMESIWSEQPEHEVYNSFNLCEEVGDFSPILSFVSDRYWAFDSVSKDFGDADMAERMLGTMGSLVTALRMAKKGSQFDFSW